ncbi:MAG TPA: exonuclease sbcCD subunit D [Roseburia sp.]|nr:exonuclease sbcCD subunit D [Roseburia sp.]
MKFLHISDLHIGKRVNEFSMIEDQKYILRQIKEIALEKQVDAVMIAGDIYDKPVPSAEAVQLFDQFLTELADCGKKVFAVSGNHDSAERIAFGAQLMSSREVYVSPVYDGTVKCVTCQDAYGELCIWLLPFIRPAAVRHAWRNMAEEAGMENVIRNMQTDSETMMEDVGGTKQDLAQEDDVETVETYQDALQYVVTHMPVDASKRNILVAHQFVTGASRCESEEISVGGLDQIEAGVFDVFDYVALGHIHSPQHIGRETLRYCGTPLKYSFSEAEQQKSVVVMEIKEKGDVLIEKVPLKPLRNLRKIRGTYMELMSKDFYEGTDTGDYLQITLTDEEDVPDGMAKLRTVYPNLMQLVYDNSRTRQSRQVEVTERVEQKSEMELFEEFYEIQNNQPMSEDQQNFVKNLLEELKSV